MRERDVEQYLVRRVKQCGGLCWKWVSPGTAGVPDRIVIHPKGIFFVELKAPGEKPRQLQLFIHEQMRRCGASVFVLDTYEAVDEWIKEHLGGGKKQNGGT